MFDHLDIYGVVFRSRYTKPLSAEYWQSLCPRVQCRAVRWSLWLRRKVAMSSKQGRGQAHGFGNRWFHICHSVGRIEHADRFSSTHFSRSSSRSAARLSAISFFVVSVTGGLNGLESLSDLIETLPSRICRVTFKTCSFSSARSELW